MDARAIIEKIDKDAQAAASDILAEAQKKASRIRAESDARIVADKEAQLARVDADAREMEQRMLRMADLEDRKKLLAAKRDLMDRTFTLALAQLEAMAPEQARRFFLERLLDIAAGGETLLAGDTHSEWLDGSFLNEANAALEKAGKNPVTAGGSTGGVGFVLQQGGSEINCTLGAILGAQRMEMETETAKILFG